MATAPNFAVTSREKDTKDCPVPGGDSEAESKLKAGLRLFSKKNTREKTVVSNEDSEFFRLMLEKDSLTRADLRAKAQTELSRFRWKKSKINGRKSAVFKRFSPIRIDEAASCPPAQPEDPRGPMRQEAADVERRLAETLEVLDRQNLGFSDTD